jgi:hypothetical protein
MKVILTLAFLHTEGLLKRSTKVLLSDFAREWDQLIGQHLPTMVQRSDIHVSTSMHCIVFGQVRQLHYGLNARIYLCIPALLRWCFWFGPCFSPMDHSGTFFSLSPVLGSVVLELYKAVFGLQFQSEGYPFLFDLEGMLLLSLFLFS